MFVLGLGVQNRTGVSTLEMRGVRRRRPIGEWTFIIQDCFWTLNRDGAVYCDADDNTRLIDPSLQSLEVMQFAGMTLSAGRITIMLSEATLMLSPWSDFEPEDLDEDVLSLSHGENGVMYWTNWELKDLSGPAVHTESRRDSRNLQKSALCFPDLFRRRPPGAVRRSGSPP